MRALRIYAGPQARRHIEQNGLQARDVGVVPAAAGGPKGLVLGPLDRFLFGQWLPATDHTIHLVGASIGAWRMATACLREAVPAFERLERDYIAQDYELPPGRKTPTAAHVSQRFGESLEAFYGGRVREVLAHPRFRLHIVTARGRHVLGREHKLATPLGYLGAFVSNTLHRKAMGAWLERVVFSAPQEGSACPLPFGIDDFPTRQVALSEANFQPALQASCSIPFVLQAVHDIPGAPRGAYWDGGITDYHLHLKYDCGPGPGLVLYPHFQKAVVPGWLDKGLKWRHRATAFLDRMIVLAPDPQWVRSLPNGKLPDRKDFVTYARDLHGRIQAWTAAAAASRQLAEEFALWLEKPDAARVEAL
ncbi:MAG TPA: phospholipase [Ramlibacter sp.]|jgi:hypothetical protein|nr:phospholipase [Ramlibacter sp.]